MGIKDEIFYSFIDKLSSNNEVPNRICQKLKMQWKQGTTISIKMLLDIIKGEDGDDCEDQND